MSPRSWARRARCIGGGRYDGLIENMGGPPTPAVGWACGIERLAMLLDAPAARSIDVALVPLGPQAETEALRIAAELRRAGLICDMAFRGNMKKRMQKADASGAAFALILGDDELAKGVAAVKDLTEGGQTEVPLADLFDDLSGRLSRMGRGPMSGWTVFAPEALLRPA